MNKVFYRSLLKNSIKKDLNRWAIEKTGKYKNIVYSSLMYTEDISFTILPDMFLYRLFDICIYNKEEYIGRFTIGPIMHPILYLLCYKVMFKMNKTYIEKENYKITQQWLDSN